MRTINKINVIDLECTCWDSKDRNPGIMEIIQMGLVTIDLSCLYGHDMDMYLERSIISSENIIVKPTTSTVSSFCTHLTGHTQKDVDNGITFKEAIRSLNQMKVNNNVWASWGNFDADMFKRQCKREGVGYPFSNMHLNVKALFAAKYGYKASVTAAIEYLGMTFEGRPHDGLDDAFNISKILLDLLT